jgi:hypothetical protein
MTGDQSRLLKVGDRVCWGATTTDLGTVVGTSWSGVTIKWDDGETNSVSHNDMEQVERARGKSPWVRSQPRKLLLQTVWCLRHISPMNIFLPDPLTREEMGALKLVATTPPLRGLPHKVQRRLIDLGFTEIVRGGLIATEDGLLRIKLGMNENLRDWQTVTDSAPACAFPKRFLQSVYVSSEPVGIGRVIQVMPYFYFDLVIDKEFKDQGGMILEDLAAASDRADQLASELFIVRSELRSRGWAVRVTDGDGNEVYRTPLDAIAPIKNRIWYCPRKRQQRETALACDADQRR